MLLIIWCGYVFCFVCKFWNFCLFKKNIFIRVINVIVYVLVLFIVDLFFFDFEDCVLVVVNNWFMVLILEDGFLYVEDVLVVYKVLLNKGVDVKLFILLI